MDKIFKQLVFALLVFTFCLSFSSCKGRSLDGYKPMMKRNQKSEAPVEEKEPELTPEQKLMLRLEQAQDKALTAAPPEAAKAQPNQQKKEKKKPWWAIPKKSKDKQQNVFGSDGFREDVFIAP